MRRWHADIARATPDSTRGFRFGKMFSSLPAAPHSPAGLAELGLAMTEQMVQGPPALREHPHLPAGFVYLGQFIAHDVSFDQTQQRATDELTPEQLRSGRSPALDLDSVYGLGPVDRHLYEADALTLKLGATNPSHLGKAFFSRPNDLPRDASNPQNPRAALLADPRNDENLAVAQTHVAFLHFHNAVVRRLRQTGVADTDLFATARRQVVQHYQWVVLHDLLPKIVDEATLDEVRAHGTLYFKPDHQELFMPSEFSGAAFRLGHNLVRDRYEWNRVFESPRRGSRDAARLHQLFNLTGAHGNLQGGPSLPTNWIIDWTRFYDFNGFADVVSSPKFNRARKIDPFLSLGLQRLPGLPATLPPPERALACFNLSRGFKHGLPAGQTVAEYLRVRPLAAAEIATGLHAEVLKKHSFDQATPLWYYILREAEIFTNGERLGPVGSRIVAETLVKLIELSPYSILKPGENWQPTLGSEPGRFGMADLLYFAGIVNPLGQAA